jgi:uncharacterized protein YndB with AHSA1/START domain
MPVKKDATHRRWVEMEILVPGTPEQVWHAMATGPGISSWFVNTTVEERVGGAIGFDLGDGAMQPAVVTAWDPPQRLAYEERGWADGAPPLATEIVVTGRSGGVCVVRMVHSLFASDESWDDQLEGFEHGWVGIFEVLRLYLRDFAGAEPHAVHLGALARTGHAAAWKSLVRGLGLQGMDRGDAWSAPEGVPSMRGVVERITQTQKSRDLMIRLDQPAPGVMLVGTYGAKDAARIGIGIFYYGDAGARAVAGSRADWVTWLDRLVRD